MIDLKVCPVCGSTYRETNRYVSSGEYYIFGIVCKSCGFDLRELARSREMAEYKTCKKWNSLSAQRNTEGGVTKC